MNAETLYDDEKAIAFIRQEIAPELSSRLSDDTLYYFLDLIDEYYRETVLSNYADDEESDEDIFIDEEDLCRYFQKHFKEADFTPLSNEELMLLVDAEMKYTESLG